jgi:DNA-binding NarL/FixJ family response regulator
VIGEFHQLPPSLGRVATLLARGASDKEIASELQMPLATARTYVARVFKRLGLTSRRQLIQRFGGDTT